MRPLRESGAGPPIFGPVLGRCPGLPSALGADAIRGTSTPLPVAVLCAPRDGIGTAQKVRLWSMLAALILGFVGLVLTMSVPMMSGSLGVFMSKSGWNEVQGGLVICLVSLVTLASLGAITLYRFLSPKRAN